MTTIKEKKETQVKFYREGKKVFFFRSFSSVLQLLLVSGWVVEVKERTDDVRYASRLRGSESIDTTAVSFSSAIVVDGTHGNFKVRGALLLDLVSQRMNLEAVQPGNELIGGLFRSVFGVDHKEHVRKACAKVGAVRVVVAG